MSADLSNILDAISHARHPELRRLVVEAVGRLQTDADTRAAFIVLAVEVLASLRANDTPQGDLVLEDLGDRHPNKEIVSQAGRIVALLRVARNPSWNDQDRVRFFGTLSDATLLLLGELPLLLEEVGDSAARAELVTLLSTLSTLPEERS